MLNLLQFIQSKEEDFEIVSHELLSTNPDDGITLKVKCKNGEEFIVSGFNTEDETFNYSGQYLNAIQDEIDEMIDSKIEQIFEYQIKEIAKEALDAKGIDFFDDTFRKEKDDDIIYTITKINDGSIGTTVWNIQAFDKDEEIGELNAYSIPNAMYASQTYELMDGISGSCYETWDTIYGKKNRQITPKLRKYFDITGEDSMVLIDEIKVVQNYQGKGIGTKIVQKFLQEMSVTTECAFTILMAEPLNIDDVEKDKLRPRLHAFYERLGFLKLRENSSIMYHKS